MIIDSSTAKQLSDDAKRYDVYSKIADAIEDATKHGEYNCRVIIAEQCINDSKKKYREILEELGVQC